MYAQHPATELGIVEQDVRLAVLLAAWGVESAVDARRSENEARAYKNLPPLPPAFAPDPRHSSRRIPITVRGVKRRVPAPPPGCYYDKEGVLITPPGRG